MEKGIAALTKAAQGLVLPLGTFSILVCFLFFIVATVAPDWSRQHRAGLGIALFGIIGATWAPVIVPAFIKIIGTGA